MESYLSPPIHDRADSIFEIQTEPLMHQLDDEPTTVAKVNSVERLTHLVESLAEQMETLQQQTSKMNHSQAD